MDGRIAGWMDERLGSGRMGRWMEEWVGGWECSWTHERTRGLERRSNFDYERYKNRSAL